jgi:RimJ/RimL family protein N-acetyltransferase
MDTVKDYSLIRLRPAYTSDIIQHIISLPPDDLYLRFGYQVKSEYVASYVTKTLEDNEANSSQQNFWYGIFDGTKLIATLHVAMGDDIAEFAFTTDTEYRGQKIGQLLFARGYQLVTEFQITRIYLACLTQNAAMRHIAKKFGMSVMTHGTDSEASINISYPVPLSRLNEVKMCVIDKGIGK